MSLGVLSFPDYDKKPPGRHRVQPSHAFTSSTMVPRPGEDSARTAKKLDMAWKQKFDATFGRLPGLERPSRVDLQDIPDLAASKLWPRSSRSSDSRPTSSAGVSASDATQSREAIYDAGLSPFYENSIRGGCPSQQTLLQRPATVFAAADEDCSRFPATMNRSYGFGASRSEGDLRMKPVKPKKLAGGKSCQPPTSNSCYGYFSQLKAHKPQLRPKGTCPETKYQKELIMKGIW